MASEIIEEENEDSYFILNKEASKEKIRKLLEYQKNHYNSSSSSSSCSSYSVSSTSVAKRSSVSSFDRNQSRKLLNLMKKGSSSLRRLFDMEHTSLLHHFDYYSASPETKTIPLWGSDSDDAMHDDPWIDIMKSDHGWIQDLEEHQEHDEQKEKEDHQEQRESVLKKQKLTRTKAFSKLPSFYNFRFRLRLRLRLRLKSRIMLLYRVLRRKKIRENAS